MIVNTEKFQALVFQNGKQNINNTLNTMMRTLQSIDIRNNNWSSKLNFEEHISVFCKKASLQQKENEAIMQLTVSSILTSTIVSLFDIFICHLCKSSNKIEQIGLQEGCLRIMKVIMKLYLHMNIK